MECTCILCRLAASRTPAGLCVVTTVHVAESRLSCVLQNSAIFKLQKDDGTPSKVPILILEVRAQEGGDRASPIEALCRNYAEQILPLMGTDAQANTVLPAVGMEVVGHRFR